MDVLAAFDQYVKAVLEDRLASDGSDPVCQGRTCVYIGLSLHCEGVR
jgi:hypothetical protein